MLRLSLDALRVLDAIDRNGSFAAAAAELHRVPSALSYTVGKLERDLGVRVFDRSGHRAVLTPAGDELLTEGRRLLQAAGELEARVKRVATGWEGELRIAVDHLVPVTRLLTTVAAFYAEHPGTRLRLAHEVYGGTWDALVAGRADLAVGATGEGPPGGGIATRALGTVAMVFAVAPGHPLVEVPEPIPAETIERHRAVAVGDTSRNLPPRTAGLLDGQDVLTVPDLATKLEAHRQGLGVGYLPATLVEREVAAGRLVVKAVEGPELSARCVVAWPTGADGKALAWFVDRLTDPARGPDLLGV